MRNLTVGLGVFLCLLPTAAPARPVHVIFQVTYVDSATGQPLPADTLGPAQITAEFQGSRTGLGSFGRGDVVANSGQSVTLDVPGKSAALSFRVDKEKFVPERRRVPFKDALRGTPQKPYSIPITLTSADRRLLFRTSPPGATVWLAQVGSAGSLSALGRGGLPEVHYLDQLRLLQDAWKEKGSAPPVNEFRVVVGSAQKGADGRVLPIPGYEVFDSYPVPGAILNSVTNGTVVIPASDQPPITLRPAPGLIAFAQRQVHEHLPRLLVLGTTLALFAVLLPTVALPRLRARRELEAQRQRRDDMLRNIDITRDPLLGQPFATSHSEWTIVKKLGAGGMAVVYWAVPTATFNEEDAVALKVMNDEVMEDPEYRKRFDREIQISNQLNHPNIVRLIDWGQRENRLFLVMEFIKGSTLREHIPAGGTPLPETVSIMRGLAAGLSHAHKLGVVHRDLKPDNIMINHNGQVKIMDLGLAKRDENRTAITKTGDTFGTPAYMAPEQIAGAGIPDPRTDQYAVGVILFELLTGRRPFEEEESLQMLMKHLQEVPPSIREIKPELPEPAAQVVARMLEKDPSARFPNVQGACAALEEALRPLLSG